MTFCFTHNTLLSITFYFSHKNNNDSEDKGFRLLNTSVLYTFRYAIRCLFPVSWIVEELLLFWFIMKPCTRCHLYCFVPIAQMPPGTYSGGGEDENHLALTSYYVVLHIMFCWVWCSVFMSRSNVWWMVSKK